MRTSEHSSVFRTPRAVLLLVGCLPMVLAHGMLSLLMVFPVVSLIGGDFRQGVFLLWWLVGTAGLGVLVYSSATFTASRRLDLWQILGLVAGMIMAVPLILGFAGEWWVSACALLASCTSLYILLSRHQNPERTTGENGTDT